MKFKLVIVSLACFSCLVPDTLAHSLVAAKAIGAGVAAAAAKGALIKGAAVLGTKAAVVAGAALAAKGLAVKGALAAGAAGAAAIGTQVTANLSPKPSLQIQIPETTVVVQPPHLSTILDRVNSLIGTFATAAKQKTLAVGSLLASLLPSKTIITKPVSHDVIVRPEYVLPPPVVVPPPVLPPPVMVPQPLYPLPPRILHPIHPQPPVIMHPRNGAFYPVPMPLVEKDC